MSENPFRRSGRRVADWAALERYDTIKQVDGYRDPRLPDELGTVHALRRSVLWPTPEDYYRGNPFTAECGKPVRVRLNVEFNPSDPDACEKCAAIVGGDAPRRNFGWGRDGCYHQVRPNGSQGPLVACVLRPGHKPPHKGARGDTWERGPNDYTPPPDGYV